MMGQGLKFGVVLLCLLAAGGCSSTESLPDPNRTVSTFCENWGRQACSSKVVLACSGADKITDTLTESCVASQQAFCDRLLRGKGYSSQNATQCLRAIGAAYADGVLSAQEIATVRHRGEPCNHLVKGPQSAGESCNVDDDCDTLENYLCVLKSGVGTCQIPTLADNGTSCAAADAACNVDFYCGADEYCVHVKDVGSSCDASFECATGLECDADSKCAMRVAATSCTDDHDCTTNVCDIPVGSDTGRCVKSITLSSSASTCEDLR
jgi:hypothetical protein